MVGTTLDPANVSLTITGPTTGSVTGEIPNVASGDLDGEITVSPGWSPFLTFWEISDPPEFGTASITPVSGGWSYEVDPAVYADLDNGEILIDTFVIRGVGTATAPGGGLFGGEAFATVTIEIEGICFTAGTLIATPDGPRAVEALRPGDMVLTRDHGPQPVRWVERARLSAARLAEAPDLRPIRIRAGALGPGVPRRDLVLSPQHRVMVSGPALELLFGTSEALVAAKSLLSWPGVSVDAAAQEADYLHVLLDRHEILDAEGAPAESLFLGEEALARMGGEGLRELAAIFGQTPGGEGFGRAARRILRDAEARALA